MANDSDYGRWVSLFVAWLTMLMAGSMNTFNVYTNALKETFNITQTQVISMSGMMVLGMNNGILPAVLSRYTGPLGQSVVALVLTTSGYFLIWHAIYLKQFYSRYTFLVSIYFTMIGVGGSCIFLAALTTCVNNFPLRHQGKSVALMDGTIYGLSPTLLAIVYSSFFSGNQNPENQDVQGYILFVGIGTLLTYMLSILFLKVYPSEEQPPDANLTDYDEIVETEHNHTSSINVFLGEQFKHAYIFLIRIFSLVKTNSAHLFSLDFQCSMWGFSFVGSVGSLFYYNSSVIFRSYGFDEYIPTLVFVLPILLSSNFCTSALADFFIDKCPRIVYVLLIALILSILQLLLAFLSDHISVLLTAAVIVGISLGLLWISVITIASELMGVANFGRTWGTIAFCYSVVQCFTSYLFGIVYDLNASGDKQCKGTACFKLTFISYAVLCIITAALMSTVIYRQKKANAE